MLLPTLLKYGHYLISSLLFVWGALIKLDRLSEKYATRLYKEYRSKHMCDNLF